MTSYSVIGALLLLVFLFVGFLLRDLLRVFLFFSLAFPDLLAEPLGFLLLTFPLGPVFGLPFLRKLDFLMTLYSGVFPIYEGIGIFSIVRSRNFSILMNSSTSRPRIRVMARPSLLALAVLPTR